MPALIQIDSQRRHELGERLTIGRGIENDVQLDDPMISRNHAEVVRQPDGGYQVRDLGSRRGTFVGARKIDAAALRDGDELLIGPLRLRYETTRLPPLAIGEPDELRKLRAVVELSRAIGVEHDLDRLLERVLETCFQLLRADRGMIIVYGPQSKTPCAMVARTRGGAPVEASLSTSVLSQVMATREPFLRTAIEGDRMLERSESLSAQGVRSLVAVPLLYEAAVTEWLGVIHLDSQAVNNVFVQRDLELLCAVAGQAALAIKNAMLVRRIQVVQNDEWQRLERVVKNLPVGVVVLDDQRSCLLVNEWVTARAGTIGEVRPHATIEHIADIPCDRIVGAELREQVTVGSPESTLILNAHTSGDGRETVIVISDITEERAQQAKAAHQDRLAMIGQLAGGIAHDFNNLLFIIVNYAGMLEESLPAAEARDDARMISQAASSATELVRQLLAFSRREAVKPKVIDVARLVVSMKKMLQRTVGPEVDLVVDVTAGGHYVLIDPSQLEQIVMNLVVNARDAITGHGRIVVRAGASDRHATIEVVDNGCGMYFTTKALGKGTGLGLATVHGIVQHVGGDITVASEVGRGTTFRIALPETDLAPEHTRELMTGPVARGRVLLVDDDDQLRRLTERMLRKAGYHVVPAANGPEALAAARCEPFDIVLTDMVMPGMSGRDLARELVAEHPQIRVVFMSGYHGASPLPDWQFIAKPFDRQVLLAKIGHVQPGGAQPPA
ncbi:MAG: response regulator [Deltaproteobacteria bacterium]|nr:MAG: response regulator [Deltaproteobacteria bacterium]